MFKINRFLRSKTYNKILILRLKKYRNQEKIVKICLNSLSNLKTKVNPQNNRLLRSKNHNKQAILRAKSKMERNPKNKRNLALKMFQSLLFRLNLKI